MAYKAVREACYSNDGGIGSLTSVGCQILFKVEAWIHLYPCIFNIAIAQKVEKQQLRLSFRFDSDQELGGDVMVLGGKTPHQPGVSNGKK